MGTTAHQVQGRGPQPVGGDHVAAYAQASEKTESTVRVTWTTTVQHEAIVPEHIWARLSAAQGPTGNTPVDQYLTDLEADREYACASVIYREVDDVEQDPS